MSATEENHPQQRPLEAAEQANVDELCRWLEENDAQWRKTDYEGSERGTHKDLRNLIMRKFGEKNTAVSIFRITGPQQYRLTNTPSEIIPIHTSEHTSEGSWIQGGQGTIPLDCKNKVQISQPATVHVEKNNLLCLLWIWIVKE
ncbi:hypothetical protein CDD83_8419 [Cordyceps sp. RAO-2017]|nr:hypothetical protein CDD83_8419 [Cordyceps sp. RAO-2017]